MSVVGCEECNLGGVRFQEIAGLAEGACPFSERRSRVQGASFTHVRLVAESGISRRDVNFGEYCRGNEPENAKGIRSVRGNRVELRFGSGAPSARDARSTRYHQADVRRPECPDDHRAQNALRPAPESIGFDARLGHAGQTL